MMTLTVYIESVPVSQRRDMRLGSKHCFYLFTHLLQDIQDIFSRETNSKNIWFKNKLYQK